MQYIVYVKDHQPERVIIVIGDKSLIAEIVKENYPKEFEYFLKGHADELADISYYAEMDADLVTHEIYILENK